MKRKVRFGGRTFFDVEIKESLSELGGKIDRADAPFSESFYTPFDRAVELARWASEKFDTLFVVGIGGSSLGTKTVLQALGSGGKKVYFLENVDPEKVSETLASSDIKRSFFAFISKSGRTLETVSLTNLSLQLLNSYGLSAAGRSVFISDAGSPFEKLSKDLGTPFLEIPQSVGGRYSVFTPVGTFPLAFCNLDVASFISAAKETFENPDEMLFKIAAASFEHMRLGKNVSVMMPYSEHLKEFSKWYSQLWAESLGKDGKGQTPVACVGTVDQHSLLQLFMDGPDDKVYHLLSLENFRSDPEVLEGNVLEFVAKKRLSEIIHAEFKGTSEALERVGRPVLKVYLEEPDEISLAQLLVSYMIVTVLTGKLMKVNPFNQPGVELGKKIARRILES